MPKELRISAIIEVPDDIWRQAESLSEAYPVVLAFTAGVEALGGKVEIDLVAPRVRGDKGDPVQQYAALSGRVVA